MPQITVNPNTYAGEALQDVIAQTVLRGETLENGLITVHSNIDKRLVVPTLKKGLTVKDSVANFTASSNSTELGEKYLDPQAFMINEEYDASNLNATWFASQQPRGRNGDFVMPQTIEDAIIEQTGLLNGAFIDASIWHGSVAGATLAGVTNTASVGVVTGLFQKAELSSFVNKLAPQLGVDKLAISAITKAADGVFTVSSTAGLQDGDIITIVGAAGGDFTAVNGEYAITIASSTTFTVGLDTSGYAGTYTANSAQACFVNASNAIQVLTRVYRGINKIMKKDPTFMLFADSLFSDAYRFAQANVATGSGSYFIGTKEMDFLGRRLVELPYVKSNFLMGAKTSDLHFGTSLDAEWNKAKIVNMEDTTADYVTRYRVDYAFDVQITNDKDLLIYRPA
jgi:hypothetical protein